MSKPKITGQGIATALVWGGMMLSCIGGGAYVALWPDGPASLLIGGSIAIGGSLLSLVLSVVIFAFLDRHRKPPTDDT